MTKLRSLRSKSLAVAFIFMLGFALFYILPFGASLAYSLFDDTRLRGFAGLANYVSVLKNPYFQLALKNTMVFTVISVPLLIVLALAAACILVVALRYTIGRHLQSVVLMPILLPSAALVVFWRLAFGDSSGLGDMPGEFGQAARLTAPVYAFFLWKNIGLAAIILMGAIVRIPPDIYEAAQIDGAGGFRKHMSITLPMIGPVMFFCMILGVVQSFKVYKEVFLLYGSYPHESLYTMQHYINNKFLKLDYPELSAAAALFMAAIFLLIGALFLIRIAVGKERHDAR